MFSLVNGSAILESQARKASYFTLHAPVAVLAGCIRVCYSYKQKPLMAASSKAPVHKEDGSRRLAALGYGILILLAAPTLRLEYTNEHGRPRALQYSALEAAALCVLDVVPAAAPATQALLLPRTWLRRLSFTLKHCMDNNKELCTLSQLTDIQGMMAEADISHWLPIFKKAFTPSYLNLLYIGGVISVFTGVIGLKRPVRLGVLGIALLGFACYMTPDANFLPTLLMQGFLGGYVLFYNEGAMQKVKQKAQLTAEEKVSAMLAKKSSSNGKKENGSPTGKASKRKANKSVYQI